MRYALPDPFKGATHIDFYEVLVTPSSAVRLTGVLGTVDGDVFVPDEDLRRPVRLIESREYIEGFQVDANGRGAPRSNFRDEDLVAHLDSWGWQDSTAWYAANPAPEPEP